jgi:cytidyltransferase-like protein
MSGSIISGTQLLTRKVKLPVPATQKVVLVGGCFDVIHYGHLLYLKNAKAQGDVLVVALENDAFIRTHKKRVPFHTQKQRAEMLLGLRSVDYVVLLPTMDSDNKYRKLIGCISPQVIAVTSGDLLIEKKRKHAQSVGAKLTIVNKLIQGLSSSTITTYARILHD